MVSDPLNADQKKKWVQMVVDRFYRKYDEALHSGALSQEDLPKDNHTLARCILIITAKSFEPISDRGKEMLENLSNFVS